MEAMEPPPPPPRERVGKYELYNVNPDELRRRGVGEDQNLLWRPAQRFLEPTKFQPPVPPPRSSRPTKKGMRGMFDTTTRSPPKPGAVLFQPQRPLRDHLPAADDEPASPLSPAADPEEAAAAAASRPPRRWRQWIRGMLTDSAALRRTLPYGDGGTEQLVVEFVRRPGWGEGEDEGATNVLTAHLRAADHESRKAARLMSAERAPLLSSGAQVMSMPLGGRSVGYVFEGWPPTEQRALTLLREAILREGSHSCATLAWETEAENPGTGDSPKEWVRTSTLAISLLSEGYDLTLRCLLRSRRGPGEPAIRWRRFGHPLLSLA
eukprot:TRINITY_DN18383_c0_g1_i2.p1 TRINITY_DN18383_c0_g1~~TRINITY_DN18383_c0_g1_i2.p1  ORF type:complete len:322 (+),score=90.83 TRINITY_DN18383_c0_g1_i2:121-1086(+)